MVNTSPTVESMSVPPPRASGRALRGAASVAAVAAARFVRGQWLHYRIFAGTNTTAEARLALRALRGRMPLTQGPAVVEFEGQFAEAVGAGHAFSFAAGRMAFYALLEALQIGPGDEVILPAFTCVVVPNAILYRGARPVYVDIDPRTFNIDVTRIEAKITPRTRAILAQHTFGLVCDVDEINRIARGRGIVVIEDCAHALGASLRERPAGSLGTAAFFSTDHTKVISTGAGGMITTSDPDLAATLAEIARRTPPLPEGRIRATLAAFAVEAFLQHPRAGVLPPEVTAGVLGRFGLWREAFFLDELQVTRPNAYPYPARLSNAQAVIGLSQLARLTRNLAWRRQVARLYEDEVGACAGLLEPRWGNHAFLRYTFLVEDRSAWQRHFADLLDMGVWFTSVTQGRDRGFHEIQYEPGSCPVAERVAAHCINLPTHPRIAAPERLVARLRQACQSDRADLRRLPVAARASA